MDNKTLHPPPSRPPRRPAATKTAVGALLLAALTLYRWLPAGRGDAVPADGDIYPDTDYPLRPATEPWDISTSVPYGRMLATTVTEGTWLRIAVHPRQDELVFDMLGDLYCMSTAGDRADGDVPRRAHALLRGIPFDKEAAFSPNGSQLAFVSDAGFGVDNLWTLPYTTCAEMAAMDDLHLRSQAVQHTNATFRFYSAPAFHPTRPVLLATKWYLTGRPNGAGELWEIPLSTSPEEPLPEHSGRRVVGRQLPPGWPAARYPESQLGAEQGRYHPDGDAVVFVRNAAPADAATGKFSYSKDVHAGITAVHLFNTTSGADTVLVAAAASAPNQPASPGGAAMPRLAPDGRTLAFVRRVDDRSVLALKDLQSGTVHYAWDGLAYDLSTIPAFMGAYPNYGFRGDGSAVLIWAGGQIWNVPLRTNAAGEREAAGAPWRLAFVADVAVQLADTRHAQRDLLPGELADTVAIESLRGLRSNEDGSRVVVEAAGDNHVFMVEEDEAAVRQEEHAHVLMTPPSMSCHSPSFVPGSGRVLQTCWSQTNLSTLYLADARRLVPIDGLPRGRYLSPVVDTAGTFAVVRTGADYMTGDFDATLGVGVWVGHLAIDADADTATVSGLARVDGATQDTRLDWDGPRLLIQNPDAVVAFNPATHTRTVVATGKSSVEMVARGALVGLRDFQHIWLAPAAAAIWTKPGHPDTPPGLVRLSAVGGHDVAFSGDGRRVFWLAGPTLYYADVAGVARRCHTASAASRDSGECVRGAVSTQDLSVTAPSILAQLRAASGDVPLALVNASLISMDPALPEVLPNATIVLHRGVFVAVGPGAVVPLPPDAAVLDVGGGAVLPGLIDIHGHWGGFLSAYPVTSWEMAAFLAYGVTTIHNPASRNVGGMVERNRIETGRLWGPRVFHTGDVLYGATQPSVYTEINGLDDARDALQRIRVEGRGGAFTAKNYQLAPRSARQRLLLAAAELDMLVVPEGGWSLDWDLTYLLDGFTTLEHPLPVPTLYDDVLSLVAASGSSYTPLAVMNYGGIFGQHWVHQSVHLPADAKLRRHLPHALLESLTEVRQAPPSSYQVWNTTRSTAALRARGVRTNVGAHGEQPIGYLYHAEMDMMQRGGPSPYEVLASATRGNAESLGLSGALGTVAVGLLADLVVYPPGIEDVAAVWAAKRDMRWVVTRGRVLQTSADDGLVELWPVAGRRQDMGRMNAEE